jgi:hypothetical protein
LRELEMADAVALITNLPAHHSFAADLQDRIRAHEDEPEHREYPIACLSPLLSGDRLPGFSNNSLPCVLIKQQMAKASQSIGDSAEHSSTLPLC